MAKVLKNQEGDSIKSITISESRTIFLKPFIVYDKLKPKERSPDILIFNPPENRSLDFLEETDLGIFAIKLEKKEKWAKRQNFKFYIRKVSLPQESEAKRVKILPPGHYLEIDRANKKMRLVGEHISPRENYTQWEYY